MAAVTTWQLARARRVKSSFMTFYEDSSQCVSEKLGELGTSCSEIEGVSPELISSIKVGALNVRYCTTA